MQTELIKRLKEKIEGEKTNLTELAKELKIPYDRMYKWLQGKGNPKPPDDKVIENWINGISSKVQEDNHVINKKTTTAVAIGEIEERLIRVEAQNEVFQATLAGLLAKDPIDFANKQAELRRAIEDAVNRHFDELHKQ